MATQKKKHAPSHIHEATDSGRQFIIHPEDNDLFVRTGYQVIEGCQLSISIEVWLQEIKNMFSCIHSWIQEHLDQIVSCYAVPRNAGTALFFVPLSKSFDFDLADLLAELSVRLMQEYYVGPVEIHQIPENELDRFIIPEMSVEIYSNAKKSHPTMAS